MSSIVNRQVGHIICLMMLLFNFKLSFGNLRRPSEIQKWENATVPFTMSHQFTRAEATAIFQAFDKISNKTCVKFIQLSNEPDFVFIQKGKSKSGCYAALGRIGGPQIINLEVGAYSHRRSHDVVNCVRTGLIEYQLMRVLGFYQEHLRPDRDDYVYIKQDNVLPGKRVEFKKYSTSLFNLTALPYDYNSITHGSLHRFSVSENVISITPKRYGVSIGQREELSDGDIQKILNVYCQHNTNIGQNLSGVTIFYTFLSFSVIILSL